jgi:hypothetical protein
MLNQRRGEISEPGLADPAMGLNWFAFSSASQLAAAGPVDLNLQIADFLP